MTPSPAHKREELAYMLEILATGQGSKLTFSIMDAAKEAQEAIRSSQEEIRELVKIVEDFLITPTPDVTDNREYHLEHKNMLKKAQVVLSKHSPQEVGNG